MANQAARRQVVFPFAPSAVNQRAAGICSCAAPAGIGLGYCSPTTTKSGCRKSESRNDQVHRHAARVGTANDDLISAIDTRAAGPCSQSNVRACDENAVSIEETLTANQPADEGIWRLGGRYGENRTLNPPGGTVRVPHSSRDPIRATSSGVK